MQLSTTRETTPPPLAGGTRRSGKYLIFQLGKEEFGIQVIKVREIMGIQDITPVPHLPPHVKGVINLRGKIIPVVDLRLKFGLGAKEYTQRTCIIVVHVSVGASEPTPIGIVVDGVAEVLNIFDTDVEDTPEFGGGTDTSYLLGMAKLKGQVKILLDIDKALDAGEICKLGALAPPVPPVPPTV
jgi:purine-binding chemotaxis protein CheW